MSVESNRPAQANNSTQRSRIFFFFWQNERDTRYAYGITLVLDFRVWFIAFVKRVHGHHAFSTYLTSHPRGEFWSPRIPVHSSVHLLGSADSSPRIENSSATVHRRWRIIPQRRRVKLYINPDRAKLEVETLHNNDIIDESIKISQRLRRNTAVLSE